MKTKTVTAGKVQGTKRGSYRTDRDRWDAVVHRDANADGSFYYSVKSTGVYCRPSCPSRRARRENVQFHVSCEVAEQAGFRACKRCQPDGSAVDDHHAAKVAAACRAIEAAEESPSLATLARAAGMSPFHFQRVFRKIAGLTPKNYALARRAELTRRLLPRRGTVTEAIYEAGFNSNSRFYAESGRTLGMKAKAFREGGTGASIRFAVGECSLGSILVAASEIGVCAILLGDDPNELTQDLQNRFPKATLLGDEVGFERTVAMVVGFMEAPRFGLNLPLDIQGTAFQRRVWKALCDIPPGSTASYGEIARRIGKPRAVRAVAGACAANVIAVAIPCHRVVRTDGSLSGYRWGVERKRSLLKSEGT